MDNKLLTWAGIIFVVAVFFPALIGLVNNSAGLANNLAGRANCATELTPSPECAAWRAARGAEAVRQAALRARIEEASRQPVETKYVRLPDVPACPAKVASAALNFTTTDETIIRPSQWSDAIEVPTVGTLNVKLNRGAFRRLGDTGAVGHPNRYVLLPAEPIIEYYEFIHLCWVQPLNSGRPIQTTLTK